MTPHYNGPFEITQCSDNGPVTLKIVAMRIRYNIHNIHTYKIENPQCPYVFTSYIIMHII